MRRLKWIVPIAAGLAVLLVLSLLAFGLPVLPSLTLLWEGAAGDKFGIARTLVKATPLCLTGLGIVIAWRAGVYNIGGEGQFVMGCVLGAASAKLFAGVHPALLNLLVLASCIAGGALYAGIAAWLQVYRGVQAVISTILLNFVALQVLDWSATGPLQQAAKALPLTDRLPDAAMLQRFDKQTDLHSGVFIALLAAIAVYVYLFLTKGGFMLRFVGENPRAALVNRIPSGSMQIRAMLISGGLCGLAGGVEYTGIAGLIGQGTAQNWGFLAIPVALLGGLHPAGVVASSLFFGALFAGSENLARFTPSGATIVYVIQAVAVLAYIGFKAWIDRRKVRPTGQEL